jgi:hypothetical protein
MDEFKPQEGERILVGHTAGRIEHERIYVYTDKQGRFVCVEDGFEKYYLNNLANYRSISWPYAKPMPPKLPEFIDGDPIIVWDLGGMKVIRIVCGVEEDGNIKCYHDGSFESVPPYLMPIVWPNYEPLPNYDYGDRKVWGSEDNK